LSDPAGVGLGEGRDLTGRYLQDHPIVRTAEIRARDYHVLQDRYVGLRRGGRRLWPKVRLAPEAQERHELLNAAAAFSHSHHRAAVEAARRLSFAVRQHRLSPRMLPDAARAIAAGPGLLRAVYRRHVRGLQSAGGRPEHVWLDVWLEQAPKPDRRISLGTSCDALGLPRARVTWRCDPEELQASRQLTRWIKEDLGRLGIAQVRELPAMTDDDAWLASVRDAFHPAGTTRMSNSPRYGVVDRDLQVHGVNGLYVVGGSVFPTTGYANPTLTIVALAHRLALHVDRVLRC
jgi:hypothetical protein